MNYSRLLILLLSLSGSQAYAQQDSETKQNGRDTPSDIEVRELTADEDPLSSSEVEQDVESQEAASVDEPRSTNFELYGSFRVRYRGQDSDGAWEDGSSRIGFNMDRKVLDKSNLFARYETGFNLLDSLDSSVSADEFKDSVFKRLGYVGMETPRSKIIAGKNWSTYYEIGSFTDRFMGAGGDAAGVFNAQSDGGSTGTGRADEVLQTKMSLDFLSQDMFKPLELNLQIQHGNKIPFGGGEKYGTAIGISSVMTTRRNLTVGVAYNYAEIDLNNDQLLRSIGLTGSSRSFLVGARKFGERWYAGMVVAKMENHETTDQGMYFDGWGSELYGQYKLTDRVWLIGGYNILEPDSDQSQTGDYRIRYAMAGLRYSYDEFRRMIFANVRVNEGLDSDGSLQGDIYTIGIKWDFSFRGSFGD